MDDYGQMLNADTVRLVRLLPGPIDRVWDYLINPEKRALWFAGGAMELKQGGALQLVFNHKNLMKEGEVAPEKYQSACDGTMTMDSRITGIEAPKRLSYDWTEQSGAGSEVTFELAQVGDKVQLTLTHTRLPTRDALVGVSGGWHAHLAILQALLEGRETPSFWATHAKLHAAYEARIPK